MKGCTVKCQQLRRLGKHPGAASRCISTFFICACFVSISLLTYRCLGDQERPNIIIILADDMGFGDVSAFNDKAGFETPNIDRLASEGRRFVHAYAPAAVCSPTRYGLLTGRYSWRTRMQEGVLYHYDHALIDANRLTVASMLKENGYTTACVGKWHLGLDWTPKSGDPGDWQAGQFIRYANMGRIAQRIDFTKPITNGPVNLGFDYFYGTAHQGADHVVIENDRRLMGERLAPGVHDDVFVDRAIQWMTRAASGDQPFFLYLALGAPHTPLIPPERLRGSSGIGKRADMCKWVDQSVGRVLNALEEKGLSSDTLVVFTSDNGGIDPARSDDDPSHAPSGPYRGFKTDAWEGGCHVPFIVKWPGHVSEGSVSDQMLGLTDIMATLAGVVDHELPQWSAEDSFNQLPAWIGEPATPVRDHVILQSYTGVKAIRNSRWKLILGTKGSGGHQGITPGWQPVYHGWDRTAAMRIGQLYDLQHDPAEQHDRFENHPKIVDELKVALELAELNGRTRP